MSLIEQYLGTEGYRKLLYGDLPPTPAEEANRARLEKMTPIQRLFEEHLRQLAGCSTQGTINQYRAWTAHFWRYIGNRQPDQIGLADVNDFLIRRCKEVKGVTLRFIRQTILRFFVWLEDQGYIAKNPLVLRKLPKITVVPSSRRGFTEYQYQAMLQASDVDRAFSWREIIIVGWNTGLRISDACNLLKDQVDLYNRLVVIVARKTRRFNKELVIPMTDELYELLDEQINHPKYDALKNSPYVFPDMAWIGMYSKSVALFHFNKIMRRACIPKGYSFHCFRHSFCSRLINSGTNPIVVAAMTGQTLEILQGYVQISIQAKKEALKIKHKDVM